MTHAVAVICPECGRMRWTNVAHTCEGPLVCLACEQPLAVVEGGFNCTNENCQDYDGGPWARSYIEDAPERDWTARYERRMA